MKLTTEEWLQHRFENTVEIAKTKTGADFDGWIEDGRYLASAVQLAQLGTVLLEGLQTIDKAVHDCPVRRATKEMEICTKCRSSRREPCGMWLNGLIQLENRARETLARWAVKTDG